MRAGTATERLVHTQYRLHFRIHVSGLFAHDGVP